jgi:branched-chain amino acid transport system permease protein
LIALVACVTYLGALGSESLQRTVLQMLVNLVLVVGLYIFVGNSGIFSFGQLTFMAVGAYTYALLTIPPDSKQLLLPGLPSWLADLHLSRLVATVIAACVAGVLALVLAVPIMRLTGITASLATFAILIIANVVVSNWRDVTGGTSGMTGVPLTLGREEALAWAAGAVVVAYVFQRSLVGFKLRASREDDVAARSIGIGVVNERRAAFVLSALVTGVGGALFAQFVGSFSPEAFYFNLTFLTIAMLVVGGIRSLAGAVLGTLLISATAEFLHEIEGGFALGPIDLGPRPGLREVGLALIMLLVLVLWPNGLTGGRELRFPLGDRDLRAAHPSGGQRS